jgi:hypothetical protein
VISINLNSKIVNPAPSVQAQWESFQLGGDLFTAREPLTACRNAEQRRGWMAALKAASDADTDIYLRGGQR